MTRDELKVLAKGYFVSNSSRQIIYGTEDRHFFNEENEAQRYCGMDKQYYPFIREDFAKQKRVEPKKPTETKVEAKKVTPKKGG
jgi:hypothetical protein